MWASAFICTDLGAVVSKSVAEARSIKMYLSTAEGRSGMDLYPELKINQQIDIGLYLDFEVEGKAVAQKVKL